MEYTVKTLLKEVNSSYKHPGNERVRAITEHLIGALYETIVKFDISHEEVWAFQRWANELGKANQVGLLGAGIGIERLLDILADEKDKNLGKKMGTPRAIEGPLYVPGAPQGKGLVRADDGTEAGEVLVMEGDVYDVDGKRVQGALVEMWMANQAGTYSIIDPTQTPYNLRRKIETENAHYAFRSLVAPGYSVPPHSPTGQLLSIIGREGNRPAHIHFMVTAPGFHPLTTQVNMPGDPYLNEDFAFATRDELIVRPEKVKDPEIFSKYGLEAPFTHVKWNFVLQKAK
jgi:catechol 1,2-dioxygenase